MTTIAPAELRTCDVRDDSPMLAHWAPTGSYPRVALCGKPIIGVPAPAAAPVCIVCDDLHGEVGEL